MNANNQRLRHQLLDALDSFARGDVTIEWIHSQLSSVAPLFERDGSGTERAVRLAEADVEVLRFTMLLSEQRPAAALRLRELRAQLIAEDVD